MVSSHLGSSVTRLGFTEHEVDVLLKTQIALFTRRAHNSVLPIDLRQGMNSLTWPSYAPVYHPNWGTMRAQEDD